MEFCEGIKVVIILALRIAVSGFKNVDQNLLFLYVFIVSSLPRLRCCKPCFVPVQIVQTYSQTRLIDNTLKSSLGFQGFELLNVH